MAKRKDIQPISIAGLPADAADAAPSIAKVEAPAIEPKIEAPKVESVQMEPLIALAPKIDAPKVESQTVETPKFQAPKFEMPEFETLKVEPKVEAPKREEVRPSMATHSAPMSGARPAAAVAATAAAAKTAAAPARSNRFVLLAASVALAAAFGAVAGALGASGIAHMMSSLEAAAATNPANDTAALQTTIGKLRSELASLRTSVDAANKSAHGQFSKIAERFDRVERGQTERTGKLAKAVEGIERLEQRADAAPAHEITGSVNPPPPAAIAAPGQPQPPIVPGWIVRNVYRGVAVIQGRRMGVVEVERGDVLPGLGRIEAIKKQDGHWVVVTSKGLITTSMR